MLNNVEHVIGCIKATPTPFILPAAGVNGKEVVTADSEISSGSAQN